jgi:very-short-patch-repair endonuclease
VLRRLAEDRSALTRVARRALEICHVDPDSGADLPMRPGRDDCEAACYDCLMSYRNQPDHPILDRAAILPVLQKLASAKVELRPDADSVEALVESELEREWLNWLRERGLRVPDRSQVLIEDAGTRPDFLYADHFVAIYVDGPHHDYPERQTRDSIKAQMMRDLGWRVVRFGHKDDWTHIADSYRDVFGAAR